MQNYSRAALNIYFKTFREKALMRTILGLSILLIVFRLPFNLAWALADCTNVFWKVKKNVYFPNSL